MIFITRAGAMACALALAGCAGMGGNNGTTGMQMPGKTPADAAVAATWYNPPSEFPGICLTQFKDGSLRFDGGFAFFQPGSLGVRWRHVRTAFATGADAIAGTVARANCPTHEPAAHRGGQEHAGVWRESRHQGHRPGRLCVLPRHALSGAARISAGLVSYGNI